jgi:hypothetical protein
VKMTQREDSQDHKQSQHQNLRDHRTAAPIPSLTCQPALPSQVRVTSEGDAARVGPSLSADYALPTARLATTSNAAICLFMGRLVETDGAARQPGA